MIFFLSEGLSVGRILSEKKFGVTGLISEKTEVLYVELNERAEAAAGSYSVTGDAILYSKFILCLSLRIIGTSSQDV